VGGIGRTLLDLSRPDLRDRQAQEKEWASHAGRPRHLQRTDLAGPNRESVASTAPSNDGKMLMDALDAVVVAVPAIREQEQPHLLLDCGYDTPACRQLAVNEGLIAHTPKKATEEQLIAAPGDPERHLARC